MKNLYEVLRAKEQQILIVRQQVEALRIAAPLLDDGESANAQPPELPGVAEPA